MPSQTLDGKPPDAVRQEVRDADFQWRSAEGVWTKQIDAEQGWRTRAAAADLFEKVAGMIREERGIAPAHDGQAAGR